ncbi:MAG: 7-carboxy-7-deazaguanine synthase QueE [Pirellulales bacterium]|nr:7-carboxy-7-deazaguanine synthase QueE [Pirellulales bacterium]
MKIAEIYKSIQGEGRLTGTVSVFVRASGCNLRCWFCDTPFASWAPEGQDFAVDEIVAEVEEWDASHVVLTGGEPMLFAELIPLCQRLRARGRHVTIETAGTLYLPVECDLMSISPKLSGSAPRGREHASWARRHERERMKPAVLTRLISQYEHQLKFVIDSPEEIEEVRALLASLPPIDPCRVLLMPQARTAEEAQQHAAWLEPLCDAEGWSYCPRMQLEWFGAVRGT